MTSESEVRQKAQQQGIPEEEVNQVVSFATNNPNLNADEVIKKYKESK